MRILGVMLGGGLLSSLLTYEGLVSRGCQSTLPDLQHLSVGTALEEYESTLFCQQHPDLFPTDYLIKDSAVTISVECRNVRFWSARSQKQLDY